MKQHIWRNAALLSMPALFLASVAHASTYCVHTGPELGFALADASDGGIANTHDNTILLAGGTFAVSGGPFTFNSSSGFALTIEGGYDSTCTKLDPTPGLSQLDGGGTSQVINFQTNGNISVQHITVQHGSKAGSAGGGGQIDLTNAVAVAVFANNQVIDNSSNYSVGGLTVFGVGTVHIDANLFAGNSAPAASALSTSMDAGSIIYLTNNTIAGNTNTSGGNMIAALGGGSASGYVSNNISYGNSNGYDFYLYSFQTFEFNYNDYHALTGAPAANSGGNVDLDPKFVGAGDYRLSGTSPLLASGLTNPTGGLPAMDLDGHAFPGSGRADMGAYEETIFIDGFDGP
ncbi:MAG TPA: hypothetical protein VLS52_05635 [Rudaea sp.]|nr:hypothetical protein [Rudaea sp.]